MTDPLLTLERVTELTGFKRSKIYAMIADESFPRPLKIGSASRWPESSIAAWIEQQKQSGHASELLD
jgi:prophage regulatory protein